MFKSFSSPYIRRIQHHINELYGSRTPECMERLSMLVGRYALGYDLPVMEPRWDQRTSLLITYGDMIQARGEKPLVTLKRFLDGRLKGAIDTVHILPFSPYSSDDGFSVIDYREVNPELGDWENIRAIADNFKLMFDLVLNHCSSESSWYKDFLNGIAPARHYFIECDPEADLDAVVRPRTSPLLTSAITPSGLIHVWTTFSDDQVDLNFANPDVLFEFLDILLFYISQGAQIFRLDAIAYLWKEIGSSCIHLPQTHTLVRLFRDFLEMISPNTLILTETNVPHDENISYFGSGDEAHIVYQFSLPPLLLHTLLSGNSHYLTEWAMNLPDAREGCTFLNFTASHDGIGVRPLEGLLPDEDIAQLVAKVQQCGGFVSKKQNTDGSESPYELNITYFEALGEPGQPDSEFHAPRFLCSQTIPLGLKGIPALYFHSLVATPNDFVNVDRTGQPRSINRKKWRESELLRLLSDQDTSNSRVFNELVRLLKIRSEHAAFHPDGGQLVYDLGVELFAFSRTSVDKLETIVCISNVTSEEISAPIDGQIPSLEGESKYLDLINQEILHPEQGRIILSPYETVWLSIPGTK